MKKNNTFKIALLMALVAGEAFAGQAPSRPPIKRPVAGKALAGQARGRLPGNRPVPVRKQGVAPVKQQKINPGVQGQKTDTTKQDVMGVVKRWFELGKEVSPEQLKNFNTRLEQLSQDDLNALNAKGIKNKQGANAMVTKAKALANKAQTRPAEPTKKESADLLKSQKTDTTKQDVMNVVKRFHRGKGVPQKQLEAFNTRLGQLSQDELNALNAKGIKNETAAIAMVQEAMQRFNNKGPKKPVKLTDMERADLLKKIEQMTKEHKDALDKKTKEKADLEKQLEAAKKSTASGSSKEQKEEIEGLESELGTKNTEIERLKKTESELRKKASAIQGLNDLFGENGALHDQSSAFAAAVKAFFNGNALAQESNLTTAKVDALLKAIKMTDGLNDIKEFAALKNDKNVAALNALLAQLQPGDLQNLNELEEFAALKASKKVAVLDALLAQLQPGGLGNLNELEEFKELKDSNKSVAALKTFIGAVRPGGLANLDQIKEFAELKAAAEGAADFAAANQNGVAEFAAKLRAVLGADVLGVDFSQAEKLRALLDYLRVAVSENAARNVANLQKLLGDLPIYEWAGNDALKVKTGNNGVQNVENADNQEGIANKLKGKKFIILEGGKLGGTVA